MRDKSGVNVKTILFSVMVLLALGMAAPAPVAAAPITGILNITGSVIVSAANIDWYPPTGPLNGTFTTKSPGTNYFSGLFSAVPESPYAGSSLDLNAPPGPVPGFLSNFHGVGMPAEYTDLSFNLSNIVMPTSPACLDNTDYAAGQSCTFGVFLLTQGNTGVVVKLEVAGHFVDLTFGDNGTLNNATGIYTTQGDLLVRETGMTVNTIRQVVDAINRQQHIDSSYSASYSANAVPEPATLLTFGLGTAALAVHRRRRAKKQAKG
jgi:hypothetical protein